MESQQEIQKLIELSKQDVENYFVLKDGRIIVDGVIYNDLKHLQQYTKPAKVILNIKSKLQKIFKNPFKN